MIYTVENRSCPVRVFVNGKEVKRAFYADTKKGVVRYYDDPVKMHKYGKRVICRTKRGKVTVDPIIET